MCTFAMSPTTLQPLGVPQHWSLHCAREWLAWLRERLQPDVHRTCNPCHNFKKNISLARASFIASDSTRPANSSGTHSFWRPQICVKRNQRSGTSGLTLLTPAHMVSRSDHRDDASGTREAGALSVLDPYKTPNTYSRSPWILRCAFVVSSNRNSSAISWGSSFSDIAGIQWILRADFRVGQTLLTAAVCKQPG